MVVLLHGHLFTLRETKLLVALEVTLEAFVFLSQAMR
jgi:hypothetical protein